MAHWQTGQSHEKKKNFKLKSGNMFSHIIFSKSKKVDKYWKAIVLNTA